MKTINFYTVLLVTMIFFVSCSKEQASKIEDEVKKEQTLEGTTWSDVNDEILSTLKFYKTECLYTLQSTINASVKVSSSYDYTYAPPIATLKPNDAGNATLEVKVYETYLTVTNTSNGKEIARLKKEK